MPSPCSHPLSTTDLRTILQRALTDDTHGLGGHELTFSENGLELLVSLADGDARKGLNTLELAATIALHRLKLTADSKRIITLNDIKEASQQATLRYDKEGEEHYNLISALHKSLRDSDPDGSLYWLYRMLESGEDPLYICRRLIRFASEDIGLADPQALIHTISCRDAYHTLGLPEGALAIAQAVVYLATAPKSNSLYKTEKVIKQIINRSGSLPVPLHLRNAPTALMKQLDYGKGYQYAHNAKQGLVDQEHLPRELKGERFYSPTTRGYEALIKDRLEKWRIILQQRKNNAET